MSGLSGEDRARVEEILPFVEGSARWSALTRLLSTIDTLTRELDEAREELAARLEAEAANVDESERQVLQALLDGDQQQPVLTQSERAALTRVLASTCGLRCNEVDQMVADHDPAPGGEGEAS